MKTLARSARGPLGRPPASSAEALDAFAKQRRLDLRPAALSALMTGTFPEEVEAWHAARATGMSLGDHLADAEHRESVPILNDGFVPNPATIEDLPTTVVWPQQAGQSAGSAARWLKWRPQWLQQTPEWLQLRWHWVVIAGIVALAAAVLLVSELLRDDPLPARRSSAALPVPSAVVPAAAAPSDLDVHEPPPPPLPSVGSPPATPPVRTVTRARPRRRPSRRRTAPRPPPSGAPPTADAGEQRRPASAAPERAGPAPCAAIRLTRSARPARQWLDIRDSTSGMAIDQCVRLDSTSGHARLRSSGSWKRVPKSFTGSSAAER